MPKHDSHLAVDDATSDCHDPGTLRAVSSQSQDGGSDRRPDRLVHDDDRVVLGHDERKQRRDVLGHPAGRGGRLPDRRVVRGDSQHSPTTGTATYAVTREETTTTYTGPAAIQNGSR